MLAVAMDVVVMQLDGVNLKEEEMKQEFFVVEDMLVVQIEGVNYKVDKGLLVKEAVVVSLFLDSEQNEKKEAPSPLQKRNQEPQLPKKTQLHHPLHHLAYQDELEQFPHGNKVK